MGQSGGMSVIDRDGLRGEIDVTAPPPFDGRGTHVLVRLPEGRRPVAVPKDALVERGEHGYFLPLSLAELEAGPPPPEQQVTKLGGTAAGEGAAAVVPVLEEELRVEKVRVETGRVRITKKVSEREEVIDEPLTHEEVEVRRVAVNRFVGEPVPVRQEGETMIVPLLEEVLVVEKRLVLKEELHITRRAVTTREPRRVTLRSEQAEVERVEAPGRDDEKSGGG